MNILENKVKPSGYFNNTREDMLKYIPKKVTRTLEFGCGCGNFSALVKEKLGAEVWGVEIETNVAKQAGSLLDTVITADAHEALSQIPDGHFDCIIMFDIIEHLIDPYSLLEKLKAKLTVDGCIVLSVPNIRYYSKFIDFVVHGNWDYRDHGILDRTHLRFFTYKSIQKVIQQLKFNIVQIQGIHPTSSTTYKLLNAMFWNAFEDVKYKQFAIKIKPQ